VPLPLNIGDKISFWVKRLSSPGIVLNDEDMKSLLVVLVKKKSRGQIVQNAAVTEWIQSQQLEHNNMGFLIDHDPVVGEEKRVAAGEAGGTYEW
jgi:hypothetical protein